MNAGAPTHGKRLSLLLIGYGKAGLSFHGGDVPVEGAFEAGLVEHHRVEGLREAANALERGLRGLENFLQIGAERRSFRGMGAGAAEHGADGGKNLAKLVVQFARNVAQGRFLGGNQFLGEFTAARGDFRETREQAAVQRTRESPVRTMASRVATRKK